MAAPKPSCTKRHRRLFRVSDPNGLHMRPAALLARAASLFDSDVFVQRGAAVARGKSLMELLKLAAGPGELLAIITEGSDAVESMNGLEDVFRQHAFLINASLWPVRENAGAG